MLEYQSLYNVCATFLYSDLAGGVTGKITYVDAGYSTVGMTDFDA